MDYKTKVLVNNQETITLKDILPKEKYLKAFFIAKTPATPSVNVGHYFQGNQGKSFWKQLRVYGILKVSGSGYEDEYLLENNFGITDIVKKPRDYSNEPSDEEYRNGVDRILSLIKEFKPKIIIFVYKAVLDKIIQLKISKEVREIDKREKAIYGFNEKLEPYFDCKVFAMPLPGVGSQNKDQIHSNMEKLKAALNK